MNKVRYPWASHLQGSCARGKNKRAGSEEFSLVLTAVSPSPGFYIMCVISSSLFLPTNSYFSHSPCLTDRLLPTNIAHLHVSPSRTSSPAILVSQRYPEKFPWPAYMYPLLQRKACSYQFRVSQLHRRAAGGCLGATTVGISSDLS